MAHIGPQVKLRRELLGWSIQKVATIAGVSASFLSRLERGMTYYSEATVTKLAGALGTSPEKLLAIQSNVEDAPIGARRIPVLDYVQAGRWMAVTPGVGENEMQETIVTDLEHPPSTFALRIRGESMEPQFKAGDVVVINPTVQPRPGDFVVATDESGEATFKQYRGAGLNEGGAEVFELHPLNPIYPPMRSDRQKLAIIGVMVEHRIYRRR